jgi:RNA polymerase sigma-70 factor (ECF subfamily)
MAAMTPFDDATAIEVRRIARTVCSKFFIGHNLDDAAQTTVMRACKSWRTYDPKKGKLKAWVNQIGRAVCIDEMRKTRFRRDGSRRYCDEVVLFTQAHEPQLELPQIMQFDLTERESLVLHLKYWRDLSIREIANSLNLPMGTVKSLLSRALEHMRGRIAA